MKPRCTILVGMLILLMVLGTACDQVIGGTAATPAPSAAVSPSVVVPPTAPLSPGTVVVPPTPIPGGPEPKRIQFQPGQTTAVLQGSVAAGGLDRWILTALAGQTLSVSLTAPQRQAVLVIWGADGTVLLSDHVGATHWSWPLPSTQDYVIDVKSAGGAAIKYTLQVTIPPQPTTGPGPQPTLKRITFAAGSTSATVRDSVAPNTVDRWVLRALAGQTMTVNVTSSPTGSVILVIWGMDGTVLISDHAGATSWSGPLPSTQDYYIDARSVGNTTASYTLRVTIPPTPGPQPTPKRISFAPGSTTATMHGSIGTSGMDRWVLKAMTGQTMMVKVTSSPVDSVILVIYGADGMVLISDHAEAREWSGQLPSTQDYHIDLKSFAGAPANYTLQVIIPPAGG